MEGELPQKCEPKSGQLPRVSSCNTITPDFRDDLDINIRASKGISITTECRGDISYLML